MDERWMLTVAGHPAWIRACVVLRRHEAAPWHDANCSSNHVKLCSGMAGSMPCWGLQRKVHAAKPLPTACLEHNVPLSLIGLGSSRFIWAADKRGMTTSRTVQRPLSWAVPMFLFTAALGKWFCFLYSQLAILPLKGSIKLLSLRWTCCCADLRWRNKQWVLAVSKLPAGFECSFAIVLVSQFAVASLLGVLLSFCRW